MIPGAVKKKKKTPVLPVTKTKSRVPKLSVRIQESLLDVVNIPFFAK